MLTQTKILIVVVTWGALLVLYAFTRFVVKDRLLTRAITISLPMRSQQVKPPGSLCSIVGVLFVFIINIITLFLLAFDALSASENQFLGPIQANLPLWVNVMGGSLFVIGTLWGFLAMVYNPNYTPLYKLPPKSFILATQGPYHWTRHPRYASEALLNISLFLLTGIWLPLLGLIGWLAMYHQAKAEEEYLMTLAPEKYGEYRKRTSMFLPVRVGKR